MVHLGLAVPLSSSIGVGAMNHSVPASERQLYPVKEFCRRNGIGKTTFYELVGQGKLQIVHVGRKALVPAWVEAQWHKSLSVALPVSEARIEANESEPRRRYQSRKRRLQAKLYSVMVR